MKIIENSEFKSYVEPNRNYGITGLTLNLNLAQCQKLKDLYTLFYELLESPTKVDEHEVSINNPLSDEAKYLISQLLPFLENFKVFDSPNDKNLF